MTIEANTYLFGRAGALLHNEYHGSSNMMTPHVIRTAMAGERLAYELSRGRGISGETILGVTVVEELSEEKTQRRPDLSDVFFSRASAEKHIAALPLPEEA